jgi:hypothetical protein
MEGFYLLLRVHDRLWADRTIPLPQRAESCQLIWDLAISFTKLSSAAESQSIITQSATFRLISTAQPEDNLNTALQGPKQTRRQDNEIEC